MCFHSYRQFSEAVLDIFNCPNITITGSTFFNNSGTGISRTPFRANSGAVAIGFDNIDVELVNPVFMVTRCNFTNNRATAKSLFRPPNNAVFNRIFSGRGGGIGMYINEYNITGSITDSFFIENSVRLYGGAIFLVVFGKQTQNTVLVQRNVFKNNVAELGGGAIISTFFSNGAHDSPHTVVMEDCSFTGNRAETGGATLIYLAFEGNLRSYIV